VDIAPDMSTGCGQPFAVSQFRRHNARLDRAAVLGQPVMRQVIWRTVRRALTRQELWNGNREPAGNFFRLDPEESVISWAWHKHDEYRDRYATAAKDPANAHLTFIRLGSRRDIDRFLAGPL